MKTENLGRALAAHPLFKDLPEKYAAWAGGCAVNVRLKKDEFLFREGAPADRLYLVRSGRLRLELPAAGRGVVGLETIEGGDVLGWRMLFGDPAWHLDCRCVEPALLLSIERRCLAPKLDSDSEFAHQLTKALLFEAHRRLDRARLQQADVYKRELETSNG